MAKSDQVRRKRYIRRGMDDQRRRALIAILPREHMLRLIVGHMRRVEQQHYGGVNPPVPWYKCPFYPPSPQNPRYNNRGNDAWQSLGT